MRMQINKKMLSIPPYISTQWGYVVNIAKNKESKDTLDFVLGGDTLISVPNLNEDTQEKIFQMHQEYLASCQENTDAQIFTLLTGDTTTTHISMPSSANFFPLLQHNVEVSGLPEVPKETILKMTQALDDLTMHSNPFYKAPEPHCQCMYCQIARVVHDEVESSEREEKKSDKSNTDVLISNGWLVKERSPDHFEVSSPDAKQNSFVVTLTPPTCSCGDANCEHIAAVLYT